MRKTATLGLLAFCAGSAAQDVAFPPIFPGGAIPLEAYQVAEIAAGEILARDKGFQNLEAMAPQCVDATIAAMAAADAESRARGLRGTTWGTNGKVEQVWEKWGDRVVMSCKRASAAPLIAETLEWKERPAPPWMAVWHGVLLRMGRSNRDLVLPVLGLSDDQAKALVAFGMDIPGRGTVFFEALVKELVCDHRSTFENPAAIGRAFDRVHALRLQEEERLFSDIERVLSPESLEKVFRYASELDLTIREVDYEASYGKLGAELADRLFDRRCGLAGAVQSPVSAGPNVPPLPPADSPLRGRGRR